MAKSSLKTKKPVNDRVFTLSFTGIFVIAFFIYFVLMSNNLTSPLFANRLGAAAGGVGLISGIYGVAALLPRPFSGSLVDRVNRALLLRVCLAGLLASMLLMTLASGYYLLLLGRFFYGFVWGIGCKTCLAIATSSLPAHKMTFGIGIYGMGQTLAQCIAPAISLPLTERIGFNAFYGICCAVLLACLALSFLLRDDRTPVYREKLRFRLQDMIFPGALPAASASFLIMCGKICVNTFLALYAESLQFQGIKWYFTLQAMTLLVSSPFVSRLADRVGTARILVPAAAMEAAALLVIAFAPEIHFMYGAAVLYGLAIAGEQPALMSACVRSAPETEHGRASNTFYIGTDLAVFTGSYIGGFLAERLGYQTMFAAMTLFPLMGAAVFFLLKKRFVQEKNAGSIALEEAPAAEEEGKSHERA